MLSMFRLKPRVGAIWVLARGRVNLNMFLRP